MPTLGHSWGHDILGATTWATPRHPRGQHHNARGNKTSHRGPVPTVVRKAHHWSLLVGPGV
eukprot:11363035-Alexandrium_andersonii.AAC.1